jgi:hypothetical protein
MANGCLDFFYRWNNPNTTLRRLYLLLRQSKSARAYSQFPSLSSCLYILSFISLLFNKYYHYDLFILETSRKGFIYSILPTFLVNYCFYITVG